MIEFHAPTPADKAWVDELLARGNYRGCDYNFTNLYVWSRAYNQRIARVDDFLVTHVCGRLGCSYMYPAGSGDIAAVIRALEADAAEKGEPLRLVCLTPRQMAELEEFFPGRFAYTADRDGYDYLYEVERLAELGGKKLHAKRNHINRFVENNPTWTYEEITPATLPECLEMDKERYRRSLQRIWETRESPCAPPWSTMRSWALRAASSGYTARWWPSPSATGCPPTPTTCTSRRPTASFRGPTP